MRYFEVVSEQFRKNKGEIKLPTRSTEHSAGYDIYSPIDVTIQPNESVVIWTDIKAHMYYDNVFFVMPRSSMGKHRIMIANTIGVIDADYYYEETTGGNIGLNLLNLSNAPYEIKVGDRIGQGVFLKYGITKDDSTTTKRTGGFGSTGA